MVLIDLSKLGKIGYQIMIDSDFSDTILLKLREIEVQMSHRGYMIKNGIKYALLKKEEINWLKNQYEGVVNA